MMPGKSYSPREIIFAPTSSCNLACGHCRVDRSKGTLPLDDALAFLADCAEGGVDRVGFSGGEPFLELGFVSAIIRSAVELGMYFDRLMTNGTWWKSGDELAASLSAIVNAGFDGTLAVSFDDWHGQDGGKIAEFFLEAGRISGRNDWFEIVSALDRDGGAPIARLESLARALDATLVSTDGAPLAIRNSAARKNRELGADDGSGIDIPILTIPFSAPGSDPAAWKAERWFSDDWCEGPGNVLYVHPDGSVAVCCGFANERPELIAGHLRDGYAKLVERARAMPQVRACYERGLGAVRKELEARGVPLPGKTSDICQFCDWLCESGLSDKTQQ